MRPLPDAGLKGAMLDALALLVVEPTYGALELLLPLLRARSLIMAFTRFAVASPFVSANDVARDSAGPAVGWLWCLRHRRTLRCTEATGISAAYGPGCIWLDFKELAEGRLPRFICFAMNTAALVSAVTFLEASKRLVVLLWFLHAQEECQHEPANAQLSLAERPLEKGGGGVAPWWLSILSSHGANVAASALFSLVSAVFWSSRVAACYQCRYQWMDCPLSEDDAAAGSLRLPPLVIVYVHGGGFGSHTPTEHLFAGQVLASLACRRRRTAQTMGARRGGMLEVSSPVALRRARVLALDYTLGHAVPRKVQVAQLCHGWRSARRQQREAYPYAHPAELKMVLAGDSAGGHLVLAMVRRLRMDMASGAGSGRAHGLVMRSQKFQRKWGKKKKERNRKNPSLLLLSEN